MSADQPPAHPLAAPLLVLAVLALSNALQQSDGHYQRAALWWLGLALTLTILSLLLPVRWQFTPPPGTTTLFLGLGIFQQLGSLVLKEPGVYLAAPWRAGYGVFFGGIGVAAVLVALGLLGRGIWQRSWFPALLVVFLALGIWVLRQSPNPDIDVFIFQQEGSAALLRGVNPYTLTFPDIYGDKPYYGPEMRHNGQVDFGFPYPPLSLLLALPGYLLFGDYRYAQLVAVAVAGALLAYARPGLTGKLAATLLLFMPRIFFVLEQGWTEPLVLLLFALTVACACRWPRALPFALGLLLASKQTMIFVPPLALLLVGGLAHWRIWLGMLWRAAVVAAVVSLPLAVGAWQQFFYSVVLLQLYQPLRTDALSYAAALAHSGWAAPSWLAFAVVGVLLGVVLWRGAATPAGFALGVGLVYLGFFAFNKQAFCNYYFFAIGALCAALAVMQVGGSATPAPRQTIRATNGSAVTAS